MAFTAIPTVKTAVREILEEASELAGVAVTAGKEPERPKEYVWIYKAKAKRDFASLGSRPTALDEDVSVYMRVFVQRGSAKAEPSEERAFEIAGAVEAALRADMQLKKTVRYHLIEEIDEDQLLLDRKRGHHVLMVLKAKARI